MGFMNDKIIYSSKTVRVYINQCHKKKGAKTNIYAIRRNDKTGLGHLLGIIKWDWGWRQYIVEHEPMTKWSASCEHGIANFLDKINKRERFGIALEDGKKGDIIKVIDNV